MKHSTERILTTHTGSLARPDDLLDMMKAKEEGRPYDREAYADRVRQAVGEVVRKQADAGVDVICDGEQSKPGFFTHPPIAERVRRLREMRSIFNPGQPPAPQAK